MKNKKELEFKRRWDRQAKEVREEDIVFGKTLGAKWSRALDAHSFNQLTTFLGIKSGHLLLDIGCGPLARAEVNFSSRGFRSFREYYCL